MIWPEDLQKHDIFHTLLQHEKSQYSPSNFCIQKAVFLYLIFPALLKSLCFRQNRSLPLSATDNLKRQFPHKLPDFPVRQQSSVLLSVSLFLKQKAYRQCYFLLCILPHGNNSLVPFAGLPLSGVCTHYFLLFHSEFQSLHHHL